jgi:hypothetical protein
MEALIDSLPGVRLPVSEVTETISRMWRTDLEDGVESPSEFHASQLNLILHFGLRTSPQEALAQFEIAMAFAEIHPARIIVLCPVEHVRGAELLEGKLYSRCFIGRSLNEMGCLEALMLSYPTSESGFLENQISIWLESDLPTYLWMHRVPTKPIVDYYLSFMKDFRRVIYDSSLEEEDYEVIDWPRERMLIDLSYTRTLPFRQSIGQFLSRFGPEVLCDGLRKVVVVSGESRLGEARGLMRWQRRCLLACSRVAGSGSEPDIEWRAEASGEGDEVIFGGRWEFQGGRKMFAWSFQEDSERALLDADFGDGAIHYPFLVKPLRAEKVLAEAMFF